jgi:hypothetical protein
MDRKVVVITKLEFLQHPEREVSAVRFRPLGLTAYGRTDGQALASFKQLFNKFVRSYRENGQLKDRLEQFGVEWYWLDEYPDGKPRYEDTSAPPRTVGRKLRTWAVRNTQQAVAQAPEAIAA